MWRMGNIGEPEEIIEVQEPAEIPDTVPVTAPAEPAKEPVPV